MDVAHLPALRGAILALLAATLFGISTPLVQRAGAGLGAFTTAALLYGGAALIGAVMRQPVEREAALRGSDLRRLALMALFGAGIGPVICWRNAAGYGAWLLGMTDSCSMRIGGPRKRVNFKSKPPTVRSADRQ